MNGVIGALLPLALAVTISPIPIVAEILLLFTRRPIANASAYLGGFILGVGVILGVLTAAAGALNLSGGSGPSRTLGVAYLLLGALLAFASLKKFRSRSGADDTPALPTWMDGIAGFAPAKSLGLGAVIGAANPKNLAVGLSAAATISSANLSSTLQATAVIIYVVIAALGVGAPLVVMAVLGEKSQPILDGWKAWLTRNNDVVMAVLYAVFTVILIGKGVAAL